MTSLFQKTQDLIAGNIHEFVDKAIDMNSIPVLKQTARRMETSLDQLHSEAAAAAGQVRTLTRQVTEVEVEFEHTKDVIRQVLASDAPTKDTVAKQQATKLPLLASKLETLKDSLKTQVEVSQKLDEAVRLLDDKHTGYVQRIQELQITDGAAKAKEHSAAVLKATAATVGGVDTSSIDNLSERIKARGDVADEKFTRELDNVHSQDDPMASIEADKYLNEIKASMSASTGNKASTSTGS